MTGARAMVGQTASVARATTESPASGGTREARDPLSLEHASSVRVRLIVSATLIVAVGVVAASFVVYEADGAQLDARNLAHLRSLLLLISPAGIGVTAALAALLSSRAVAPLRRLAISIERVVETGDQGGSGACGAGEVSRLAVRLDQLVTNIEESPRRQPDLLLNAAGELGTGVATLRANFAQLANSRELDARDQAELLSTAARQLKSIARLVDELLGAHAASEAGSRSSGGRIAPGT
ncbi:MAG TPA: hypothetical protein VGH56_13190 [Solirubrobacteraceae bacterium]